MVLRNVSIVFSMLSLFSLELDAQRLQRALTPSRNLSCIWQATIGTDGKLCYRRDGKVSVQPRARQAIKSIELIISGKSMGKDSSYPFSWKIKPKSKGLYAGRHRATAKIMDICGKEHLVHKVLEVRKCPAQ